MIISAYQGPRVLEGRKGGGGGGGSAAEKFKTKRFFKQALSLA